MIIELFRGVLKDGPISLKNESPKLHSSVEVINPGKVLFGKD
jgi:hypothetical protein